jgi:hypothetical protein
MHTQTAHQHSPISLWRTHNLEKQTKTANSAVTQKKININSLAIYLVMRDFRRRLCDAELPRSHQG